MFAKNRHIKRKFGMPDVQAWFYMLYLFWKILKILSFVKSFIKVSAFFYCWGKKNSFLWIITDSYFKEPLILRILMLFV